MSSYETVSNFHRKKALDTVVRTIAVNLARATALVSLLCAVARNLQFIRRSSAILLMPDGGFGHTIMSGDWMRRLHPNGKNLIFFAVIPKDGRHNPYVPGMWPHDRFVWTRKGIDLPVVGAVHDPAWLDRVYRAVWRLLRALVPGTPCYCSIVDLINATPRPDWLASDNPFNDRYESRYYPLMQERPLPAVHVADSVRYSVARTLADRFGTEYQRRCALYIRYASTQNRLDCSSVNRLSAPFESYFPVIKVLNDAGYQILLTGDVVRTAAVRSKLSNALIDAESAGLDPNKFRLFAGTEVDLHIGSLSGGSSFTFVTDIPSLMLNAFAPGDGLPKTTVFYKWLFQPSGSIVGLKEFLGGKYYDHQLHGCTLLDNDPDEMAEAVRDFLSHLDERPYGVDPAKIGVSAPWLRAANARISPVWLKHYYSRVSKVNCDA